MPVVKSTVLSSVSNFPFGNSVENFFQNHRIKENIEIYYFFSSPYDDGTSINDLSKIKYTEDIIIWVAIDSLIDKKQFNYYKSKTYKPIKDLEKICKEHPTKKFILYASQFNLNRSITEKNFCAFHIINYFPPEQYKRCKSKEFGKKQWITLNSGAEAHRLALVSYLLGENLHKTGNICIDTKFNRHMLYEEYFCFKKDIQKKIRHGNKKLKHNKGTRVIGSRILNNIENYNQVLLPLYETIGLEIITGSLFFQSTPFFSEKEFQSVYGKNFPIFLNASGFVDIAKNYVGLDIFEDIIDHSYDSVEDPTERLISAVTKNLHLLNGDTSIAEAWYANQDRFDKNCDILDKLLYNKDYQRTLDAKKIKAALDYFSIDYVEI